MISILKTGKPREGQRQRQLEVGDKWGSTPGPTASQKVKGQTSPPLERGLPKMEQS